MNDCRMHRIARLAVALSFAICAPAAQTAEMQAAREPAALAAPAQTQGQREFGNYCAQGLAEGKRIRTDCSVSWTAPDGRVYCFRSPDSRAVFLENPPINLEKARDFLASAEAESSAQLMSAYTTQVVKDFVARHVEAMTANEGGVFHFRDVSVGENLELVYVEFNMMRTLDGYGYFPDLVFASKDDPDKKYWIDLWVKPRGDRLEVIDTRIYKGPKRTDAGWTLQTRSPRPWWWIPASEHPGKMEVRRGWEVMSAVEEYIVGERAKNDGKFVLKDDQTGEKLVLDFIGTHQPVRRLDEDGRFFACTDFRREDSGDQYYDIDFWIDEKTGHMQVGEIRVHKVPVKEDGTWIQVPRYNFDKVKFNNVP